MSRSRVRRFSDQDIIQNMGLFWDANNVRWRGNAGIGPASLTGKRATAKRGGEVNFWDQTGIYALYQRDYRLIYVGQAGLTDNSCMGSRIKAHLTDSLAGRWALFSWFGLQRVLSTTNGPGKRTKVKLTQRAHLANVLEGIVIEIAEPPMNSQRGRFGKKVERYLQVDQGIKPQELSDEKLELQIAKVDLLVKRKTKQLLRAINRTAG
jgi:hypothetical protein